MRIDDPDCRTLAAATPVARLATTRPDGRADLVPVVVAFVDDAIVFAVDHKPKTTHRLQRLVNIEHDPRVTLLFDHYEDDWTRLWWVRVRGRGEVVSDDDERRDRAVDALRQTHRQYEDRPPTGPVVWIVTTDWRGWRSA